MGVPLVFIAIAFQQGHSAAPAWADRLAADFLREGIFQSYPESPYRVRPEKTRFEMGVIANAIITYLPAKHEEWLTRCHSGKLTGSHPEMRALHLLFRTAAERKGALDRFLREFTPEMKGLGVDPAAIAAGHRMFRRLPKWAEESGDYYDRPVPKPVVNDLLAVYRFVPIDREPTGGFRPPSHWEVAIVLQAFCARIEEERKAREEARRAIALAKTADGDEARKRISKANAFLRAAAGVEQQATRLLPRCRFAWGILGVDRATYDRYWLSVHRLGSLASDRRIPRPGEALRSFPEVPKDHWASAALTHLRAQSVLNGYPDGKFKP